MSKKKRTTDFHTPLTLAVFQASTVTSYDIKDADDKAIIGGIALTQPEVVIMESLLDFINWSASQL